MSSKLCAYLLFVLIIGSRFPHQAYCHDLGKELFESANRFLQSLEEQEKESALFPFDSPLRENWHFIPKRRPGIAFDQLNHAQRYLGMSLLQTALSHRGFDKSMKIMALEQVLFEVERSPRRDAGKYHLFFFGSPSSDRPWGWRIEGHHLSINVTVVDESTVVITPTFLGANPAEVRRGKLKGMRPLAEEEDLARALVERLSTEQKAVAILKGDVPRDIILGPERDAEPLRPAGIAAAAMNQSQQRNLREIIETYLGNFRSDLAAADRKRINEAGFENVHFAWAGKLAKGEPNYYRIQGPTFIMEYDNTQNGANHVHTVWRDFKNDFGEDSLKQHYLRVPHNVEIAK